MIRRHVFLFRQPSGPGKEFESTIFSVGRSGGGGRGGDHLIFRRTEGGIIRNWEPKKEIIVEELEELRRTTHVLRVSRLRRSRARALLRLNLKKKRDCSQSRLTFVGQCQFERI